MTFMGDAVSGQVPATLIMLGLICAFGCIGNTLIIIVYSSKHDRLTSTVFILALAMSDSFACTVLIPLTMYIESVNWKIKSVFLCKFYYVINNSFVPFSSLLISGIAFDRYFCICHPFAKILTVARAKYVILFMIVISVILGGVSAVTVIVTMSPLPGNTTQFMLNGSKASYEAIEYQCTEIVYLNATIYERAIYKIAQSSQLCSYVFCILCVACLYILIYRSVLKMQKKHSQLTGRKFASRKRHSSYAKSTILSIPEDTMLSLNKERSSFFNSGSLGGENTSVMPDEHKFGKETKLFASEDDNVFVNDATVNANAKSTIVEEEKITPNAIQEKTPNKDENSCEKIWQYHPTEVNTLPHLPRERLQRNYSVRFNQQQDQAAPQAVETSPARQFSLSQDCNQATLEPAVLRCNRETQRVDRSSSASRLHGHRLSIKSFKDTSLFQNMKMAGMLFVVAIVYILTFIPAMLMASDIITLFLPIFYLYYANNAVNPIIYCFMNPNFRADIRAFLKLRTGFFRRQGR